MSTGVHAVREDCGTARAAAPYREEIKSVAGVLERVLPRGDLAEFYRAFRGTSLPFLCGSYRNDPGRLFPACFDIVHELGGISPAVALAVENHFYVTSAIATFPTAADPALDRRREELLATIIDRRWLVANTNSKVHTAKIGELGTLARRVDAGFLVNGVAAYTSLATESDLLVLMTELEGEGFAVFSVAPMQGNPAVEIGPWLFPNAMLDSDTRRISFRDLFLPPEALVAGSGSELSGMLFPFEMAWHQLLIPALYLGAAARAIAEVRAFLVSTQGRDGKPLSELDGMVIDVGRLALEYQAARCVVEKAGDALSDVRELPRDARKVERAVHLASAAKYVGTRAAESIVTAARRIVGARIFSGSSPLERLSQEVMFASLGPEVSAVIERRYGKQALEGGTFPCFS